MWDDQLGLAVLQHASSKTGITMGYSGVIPKSSQPGDYPSGNIVAANVAESLEGLILTKVSDSQLTIPGYRGGGAEPTINQALRPTYKESQFTICAPRSNGDLPLHQSVMDEWSSVQAARNFQAARGKHV